MSDYSQTDIGTGYNSSASINTETTKIETAVNSKMDKSGSTMTGDLDLNSNDILNAQSVDVQALSIAGTSVTATGAAVSTLPTQASNSGKVLSTNGSTAEWIKQGSRYYSTLALATADASIKVGDTVVIGDRANGLFEAKSGLTANGYNIVAHDTLAIQFELVIEGNLVASQFGETAGALQAIIDYALVNNFPTIDLDKKFDITGSTLLIDKGVKHTEGSNDFARKRLTFEGKGVGEIYRSDADFMFSATSGRNGDIAFDNVTFSGTIDNTGVPSVVAGLNAFDCDKLIRLSFTNCTFRYLDFCFYQEGTVSTPMQSIKVVNNTFTKNRTICHFNQAWDVVFDGGLIEDGNQFITCKDVNSNIRNLIVSNGATIEGMIARAIELNCVHYGTKIVNCYFEANLNHIQMNRFNAACSIENNTFLGRGSVPAGNTVKCIDIAVGEQGIKVDGNLSTETNTNTILISIDETSAFNSARYNLIGTNVTLGSTLTDKPLRLLDSFNIANDTTRGVDFGITADVSSVQGGRPLTASINEISTCANAGDSVTLLPAVSGLRQTIINNGANACDVFPNTGDNLGVGANTAVSLPAGSNITYVCYDFATNWVALT